MTGPPQRPLQRVLLGVGAGGDTQQSVAAATTFAIAFKTELQCIFVDQEALFDAARLPFTRTIGPGGLISDFSIGSIEAHFNRLFRDTRRALDETCQRLDVTWHIERPLGEFLREIRASLVPGDAIVLSRTELERAGVLRFDVLRELLATAAAVIIPSSRERPTGSIIALGGGSTLAVARDIGLVTGKPVERLTPEQFGSFGNPVTAVVASVRDVEQLDGDVLFRKLKSIGAMGVLLSDAGR